MLYTAHIIIAEKRQFGPYLTQWVLLQEVLKQSRCGVLHKMSLVRFALCSFAADVLLSAVWLLNVHMHSWPFNVLENQIFFVWTGDKVVTPVGVNFFEHNWSTLFTNQYILVTTFHARYVVCGAIITDELKTIHTETYRTVSPEI